MPNHKPDRYKPNENNSKIIRDYLKYLVGRRGCGTHTLNRLSNFYNNEIARWMEEELNVDLDGINAKIVIEFSAYQAARNYMHETIKTKLNWLSMLVSWMYNQNLVGDDCWPKRVPIQSLQRLYKKDIILPTYKEVLMIRREINITNSKSAIRNAFLFEAVISSGMRIGEILQLREGDIILREDMEEDQVPFDSLHHCPSRYVGGVIKFKPRKMKLKNNKPKTVYISHLAAKVYRKFLILSGLSGTKLPLVPLSSNGFGRIFEYVGDKVLTGFTDGRGETFDASKEDAEVDRKAGFRDIDIDDMDIDEKFKEMIRRRQANADEIERDIFGDDKSDIEEINIIQGKNRVFKRKLNPHSVRHFFASAMYYRAWNGNSGDLQYIAKLLGHSDLNTLSRYLQSHRVITQDHQWHTLFIGQPREYINLLL